MVILQEDPIDVLVLRQSFSGPNNGALVAFEGLVRADQSLMGEVAALLYIADIPVCVREGEKITQEVKALFPVTQVACVQRIGQVKVGELAVWIGVWAAHRDEAFLGCRYMIEEIKKRLLIWKKEVYTDGSSQWIHGTQAGVELS